MRLVRPQKVKLVETTTLHTAPSAASTRLPSLPRNIRWYYLLEAGTSTGFIMGNWIFFWLRYMTYGQLGLIDGLIFGFGMFMEIPTGALSDMLGKRRTLVAAMGCVVIGTLIMATTNSLEQLVIGFLIQQIGWAFHSGASEAFAYESLKEHGLESEYPRVISRSHMIGTVVFITTTLLGGGLYLLHFRLPHFAWALAYGVSLIAALLIREPRITHTADTPLHPLSLGSFVRQITDGVQQLRVPALRPYMLLIFVVSGVYTLYIVGLVQPALGVSFGFDAAAQSIITVLSGIISAGTLAMLPTLSRRLGDRRGLLLIAFGIGFAWLLAAFPLGAFGLAVMLLIRLAGDLSRPWISMIVNQHIESRARATALSAIALMSKIPYVVTAAIAGQLIEGGVLWAFNLGLGLMVMAAIVIAVVAAMRVRAERSMPAPSS